MTDAVVVRRAARRRAVGSFVAAVIIGGFGIAMLPLAGTDGALASFAVVAIVIGVIAVVFGGIAVTIARHFPQVAAASGVNALFGILLLAAAAGGIVATFAFGSVVLPTLAFALFTLVLTAACGMLWNANRADLAAARAG